MPGDRAIRSAGMSTNAGAKSLVKYSTDILVWSIISGNIDYIGTTWQSSDVGRNIDLNGNTPGAISQTFDTVPGTAYTVLFDMAGNTHSIRIYTMKVSAAGESREYTFDNFGKTTSNMGWEENPFSFIASDSTTTLTFESLTNTGDLRDGPALDNSVPRFRWNGGLGTITSAAGSVRGPRSRFVLQIN